MTPRRSRPALEVRGLDVYYGHSHALQGVDLTLESGVSSWSAATAWARPRCAKASWACSGQAAAQFASAARTITNQSPARVARLGVGYVPQGRRLWRSLSVDEHLRLAAGIRRGPWSVERIYETFPAWPNGRITAAASFPAASSRCSRSLARF